MLTAKFFGRRHPFTAEQRLLAARCIVNARVDHAGVMAGLVRSGDRFFLKHDNRTGRVAGLQLQRGRDPDDPATDNQNVCCFMHREGSDLSKGLS